MNFNLNKKEKELLMYCVLAFATGYLMCMYFPVHLKSVSEGFTGDEIDNMSPKEMRQNLLACDGGNGNGNGGNGNRTGNNGGSGSGNRTGNNGGNGNRTGNNGGSGNRTGNNGGSGNGGNGGNGANGAR
jgi:hypothetical protein